MHGKTPAFDSAAFSKLLRTRTIGRRLAVHDSVPSTMTLADELLRAEGRQSHGSIVLAESQTAGLGRRGRSWQSMPLGNLYFSLLWAPLLPAGGDAMSMFPQLVRLNLAAGVAVCRASEDAGIASARIKWPNDVWAGDPPSKMSGTILNFDGSSAAVLGVGINVLQDFATDSTATSLETLRASVPGASGPPISREGVLASFCFELERLMDLSTEQVLAEYRERDLLRGRTIRVHHKTREESDPADYDAEVLGVNSEGLLRVRPLGAAVVRVGSEVGLSGEEVSITPK
jgi:BirA family biotin operon repressor/biotin-[acetyl-CoA-carboxylase] ligase